MSGDANHDYSVEGNKLKNIQSKRASALKIHFVHVGSMNNKGAEILLKNDICATKKLTNNNVSISVSTSDLNGVGRLKISIDRICPQVVDIPFEQVDLLSKKRGCARRDLWYKILSAAWIVRMIFQVFLSAFSSVITKIGLPSFYRPEVLECIRESDLVISCSDENFKEGTILLPPKPYWILTWWSVILARAWAVLVAKYYGKRVVMFPNSIGPFRTIIGRLFSKLALGLCDLILVREPISFKNLEDIKVRTPKILTCDTSFILCLSDRPFYKKPGSLRVGLSLGVYSNIFSQKEIQKLVSTYANSLDRIVEKFDVSLVFLPHFVSGFEYDDLQFSDMIKEKMKNGANVEIMQTQTVEEFKSIMGNMDLVISSKMHPSTIALSCKVPTICIAYDHKQKGLFESLEMSRCLLFLPELSEEKLFSHFCYVWSNREIIRRNLEVLIPSLQASVNNAIAQALLLATGLSSENVRS
jgi:colanic acid/amylovoran biosynthesis protein